MYYRTKKYKKKDGSVSYYLMAVSTVGGKRKEKRVVTAHSAREAKKLKAHLQETANAIDCGINAVARVITIAMISKHYVDELNFREVEFKRGTESPHAKNIAWHMDKLGADITSMKIDDLTAGRLNSKFKSLEVSLSKKSINHIRSTVITLIKRAQDFNFWDGKVNVGQKSSRLSVPKADVKVLSFDQTVSLFPHIEDPINRAFCEAIYEGAFRVGEAAALTKWDINENGEVPELTISKSFNRQKTKTGLQRVIPIWPRLYEILKPRADAAGANGLLFPRPSDGQMRTMRSARHRWYNRALQEAEIHAPGASVKSLRHGGITRMFLMGASKGIISKLVGHVDWKQAEATYLRLTSAEVMALLQKTENFARLAPKELDAKTSE